MKQKNVKLEELEKRNQELVEEMNKLKIREETV